MVLPTGEDYGKQQTAGGVTTTTDQDPNISILGIDISRQQATDINPFDEPVISEILGGTTPNERTGGDQPGMVEDVLDIADPNTDIEGSDLEDTWNRNTPDFIPEDPQAIPFRLIITGAVVVSLLWLLRPILEIVANATGG